MRQGATPNKRGHLRRQGFDPTVNSPLVDALLIRESKSSAVICLPKRTPRHFVLSAHRHHWQLASRTYGALQLARCVSCAGVKSLPFWAESRSMN
jgi:hypothetical protein